MALPRPLTRLVAPHRAFGDDENRTALPVALGLVLLVAVVSAVSFSMAATPIAAAGVMLAFGLPYALFPVALIRLSKRLELIGFRGDVEPEEWYVNLHRYGGLVAACLGFLLVGAPPLVV